MSLWNVAERVATCYARNPKVLATVVAGSVGRDRSDEFSDVEIDVYWASEPTDSDRLRAVDEAGGLLTTLWDYDPDDAEWSEDFVVEGVPTTTSSFTCAEIERVLEPRQSFAMLDQLRLSALYAGRVVTGGDLVDSWRARGGHTDELQASTVRHFLDAVPVSRWRHVPALTAREDLLSLRLICDDMLLTTLGLLFGLNRTYVEHPRFKWAHRVMGRFEHLPADAAQRVARACTLEPVVACEVAGALLSETLDLLDGHVPGVPVADLRRELSTARLPL